MKRRDFTKILGGIGVACVIPSVLIDKSVATEQSLQEAVWKDPYTKLYYVASHESATCDKTINGNIKKLIAEKNSTKMVDMDGEWPIHVPMYESESEESFHREIEDTRRACRKDCPNHPIIYTYIFRSQQSPLLVGVLCGIHEYRLAYE